MNMNEVKEKLSLANAKVKNAMLAGSITAMTVVPTMFAYAEEPAASGKDLLAGDVWTAITGAFGDLATTTTKVVAISVVTGCSIIGMSAAANYAMKKIKGMLSKAA